MAKTAPNSRRLDGHRQIAEFVKIALKRSKRTRGILPPIITVIGAEGYGKSTLLRDLAGEHGGTSPLALIDLAALPSPSPVQIMREIERLLSRKVPAVARIKFPILLMGVQAISAPSDESEQRFIDRAPRKPLEWYGRTQFPGVADDEAAGAGYRALRGLRERWQDYQSDRGNLGASRDAWQLLCQALLEDLRAFTRPGLGHGVPTTNCLLLLDNADTESGQDFLSALAKARTWSPNLTDPLVVVAAFGTLPADLRRAADSPLMATDPHLTWTAWYERARQAVEGFSPWYRVQLSDLSLASTRGWVTSQAVSTSDHDAEYVYSITQGHPGATLKIAKRLQGLPTASRAGHGLPGLISAEAEDDLLAAACPPGLGDRELDALTVFAATLRPTLRAAGSVFQTLMPGGVRELDARDLFLSLLWADGDDPLAIRPYHRWLLSRRLARDGTRWQEVHEAYLKYYTSEGGGSTAQWYHRLALASLASPERLHDVARYLDRQFEQFRARNTGRTAELPSLSEGAWNDMLADITSAPNRLLLAYSEQQAPGPTIDTWSTVGRLEGIGESPESLRAITRLVAARWLLSDPALDPLCNAASIAESEYLELARLTPGGTGLFYAEATRFRDFLTHGRTSGEP